MVVAQDRYGANTLNRAGLQGYTMVIKNYGSSNISEPTQELHSRATPSVEGNTTTQSVQPQGEIPEEGRNK